METVLCQLVIHKASHGLYFHIVTASSLHSPWLYLLDALNLRNITEGFASAQSLSKVPDGGVTKTPPAPPLQCCYLQYLAGRLGGFIVLQF